VPTYYEILGVPTTASLTEIRAAYKRLAFRYHPDLHPGDPVAEEQFKRINEAYHTLADPVRKARYDARLYACATNPTFDEEAYWRAYRYRQYVRWKKAQESRYTLDRNYFKIQGLTLLVFLIISGFSYGIINSIYYLKERQYEDRVRRNVTEVNAAYGLFNQGQIDEAFTKLLDLMQKDPLEFRFTLAYDSLLRILRSSAQRDFNDSNMAMSLHTLRYVKRYETPTRFETLRLIAICQYNLKQFDSVMFTLKEIQKMQPWNFELVYQMGIISLENLKKPEEAVEYFTQGKRMFKESMSRIYGEAFEVVMNPADAPEIYYDLFEARARANFMLKNYEEALTDCNWAVFLRPQHGETWKLRALCRIALGKMYRVCDDLAMASRLGAANVRELQRKFCPR
jgi:curved DNA-binding protein CbpA